MNTFLHGVARAAVEVFDLPSPILEIGSHPAPGQEALGDLRGLFPDSHYLGVDLQPGPGVDLVASVESLPLASSSVGTVLALNVFEHVRKFWRGLEEVRRVLRPNGAVLFSAPFYFHIHNHPADYWRFTPAALEVLFEEFPSRIIGFQGPRKRPLHVWALAFREGRRPIPVGQFEQFRARVAAHGRQPLGWRKYLRYRLGQLLCGPRPFAPYLEQGSWEMVCQNTRTAARRPRLAGRAAPSKG